MGPEKAKEIALQAISDFWGPSAIGSKNITRYPANGDNIPGFNPVEGERRVRSILKEMVGPNVFSQAQAQSMDYMLRATGDTPQTLSWQIWIDADGNDSWAYSKRDVSFRFNPRTSNQTDFREQLRVGNDPDKPATVTPDEVKEAVELVTPDVSVDSVMERYNASR